MSPSRFLISPGDGCFVNGGGRCWKNKSAEWVSVFRLAVIDVTTAFFLRDVSVGSVFFFIGGWSGRCIHTPNKYGGVLRYEVFCRGGRRRYIKPSRAGRCGRPAAGAFTRPKKICRGVTIGPLSVVHQMRRYGIRQNERCLDWRFSASYIYMFYIDHYTVRLLIFSLCLSIVVCYRHSRWASFTN